MICAICGKKLSYSDITAGVTVWMTILPVVQETAKATPWAKTQIHEACQLLVEQKQMSSKIAIAAGYPVTLFSSTEPK